MTFSCLEILRSPSNWPLRLGRGEAVRCSRGGIFFSSPNDVYNSTLWPFCPPPGNLCGETYWILENGYKIIPDNRKVFAFLGESFSGEIHCFDCSLVSSVYHSWIYVMSTVTKLSRNFFGLLLNSEKHCSDVTL